MRLIPCLLVVVLIAGCAQRNVQSQHWTWTEGPRVTDVSLRGLSVVSERVAWASGQNGTVLRTTDGKTWRRIVVPGAEQLDLRDVEAFDERSAVVMSAGSPARIYRTTDAGRTWQLVYENDHPEVFLDCIAFHRNSGLAFGDPLDGTLLLASSDAGASWRRIPPSAAPQMLGGEAGFAASGTNIAFAAPKTRGGGPVVVTGGQGGTRALRSPDGWSNWSTQPLPLATGAASRGAFSVCFDQKGNGVVVGGDYLEPNQRVGTGAWSNDGGRSWAASDAPPTGYRSCVAVGKRGVFAAGERDVFVAVGTNGVDLSLDRGRNWKRVSETGYHAIAFAPHRAVGFAVGSEGRVARVSLK